MTTDELIRFLRNYADYELSNGRVVSNDCLLECADRLEELDERVAILQADTDPCRNCQEFVCDNCEYAKEGKE